MLKLARVQKKWANIEFIRKLAGRLCDLFLIFLTILDVDIEKNFILVFPQFK